MSFLLKLVSFSNFLIKFAAKFLLDWLSSVDETIWISQFKYFFSSLFIDFIFTLSTPSTNTFTVPSGSLSSCKILLKQPKE